MQLDLRRPAKNYRRATPLVDSMKHAFAAKWEQVSKGRRKVLVDGIFKGNYTYYKLYLLEDNSNLN